MAVTAMTGVVGFAPQNKKSTDGGYVAPTTWYRHKATLVDLAISDETRLGAPEVGGIPIPTFPYKAGVLVGGGLTIQPRLQDTIGWLLYGVLGSVTSSQQSTTGVYDHVFQFLSSDNTYVPWMAFRKATPRKDNVATSDLGEIYRDCKVLGFSMNLANDAPITSRVDVMGRTFELVEDPTAWTWSNSYEGFTSIPIGCQTGGYVKLTDYSATALPIMAATVGFQNIPLDIRQDRVFGSAFVEDITIIMRQLTFDILVKWNDPDLYQDLLTGATTGTAWSASPFTSAVEIFAQSPGNIPTKNVPWSIKINAPKAMLAMNEGIQLAGNQAIMMRITGTAIEPDAGNYTSITLTNTTTQYSWPA